MKRHPLLQFEPMDRQRRAEVCQIPQPNKPGLRIPQEVVLGVMKMSKRDKFLTREQFMDMLMHLPTWDGKMPPPVIRKPVPLWTGKQLFTCLIPGDVNLIKTHANLHPDDEDDGPHKWISPGDTKVMIKHGELIMGIMCKKTLGTSEGCLLHVCSTELGYEVAGHIYESIQSMVNHEMSYEGQSISIGDIIKADVENHKAMKKAKEDLTEVMQKVHNIQLGPTPSGKTRRQGFENQVNHILSGARDKTGTGAGGSAKKPSKEYNDFLKAIGLVTSEGSNISVSHVITREGEQNIEAKRTPFGPKRSLLPRCFIDDSGPEPREPSYLRGLSVSEFFKAQADKYKRHK